MFCRNCGKQIGDSAVYCPYCGNKQINNEKTDNQQFEENSQPIENQNSAIESNNQSELTQNIPIESDNKPQKNKNLNKKILIGLSSFLVVLAVLAVILYPKVSQHLLSNKNKEAQIAEYQEQVTDIIDDYNNCVAKDDEKHDFEIKLDNFQNIEKEIENYEQIKTAYNELSDCVQAIKERNKTEFSEELERLKAENILYATKDELSLIDEYQTNVNSLISDEKFIDIPTVISDWNDLVSTLNTKKTGITVKIVQEDYSNFPNIKLYLDIVDAQGNVISDIPKDMFFLSEKVNGQDNFIKASIETASQLNEKEALNINLVADTSGSMYGGKLTAAQDIMSDFINSVQFSAGDSVRLTAFESEIYAKTDFLSSAQQLNSVIYSLEAGGGTRLYDTLMRAVQDTNVRDGAKCVIAFTDGMDGESVNSPEQVVNAAKFYGIPIYIVRIGSDLWSEEEQALRLIAEGSGGIFYTSDSFNQHVADIYSQIYRDIKQYYVVEYTTSASSDISSNIEYEIYIRDNENGGYNTGNYQASEDVFGNLYWKFLNAYVNDMKNYEYSELDNYIDSNVPSDDKYTLYYQMKKQVSRGFEDVDYENLLTVDIKKIEKQSDDLYLLYSDEEYDSVYTKSFADLTAMKSDGWVVNRSSAEQAFEILQNQNLLNSLTDTDSVTVHQVTHQSVVYQIKKASDGKWKFYKYNENIKFENPDVYRVVT